MSEDSRSERPDSVSSAPKNRAARTVVIRSLAGIAVTIVLFAVAEFTLVLLDWSAPVEPTPPIRLFSRELAAEVPESRGMFKFDPYVFWALKPGAPVFDRANERISFAGFRGEDVDLARSPGSLRIAFLGDSSTFGVFCALAETYPERVAAILDARLSPSAVRDIEIINAGVPGYTAFQGLQTFQRKVRPFAPDVVVLMFGAFNECLRLKPPILGVEADMGVRIHMAPAAIFGEVVAPAESHEGDDSGDVLAGVGPGFVRSVSSHLSRFRTFRLLASLSPRRGESTARAELVRWRDGGGDVSRMPRLSVRGFSEIMSSLIEICEDDGASVIVLGPPRREELRRTVPQVTRFNPALAEVSRRWGVPYVDLEPVFDADPSLFIPGDPVHPNPAGHAAIAERIAELILAWNPVAKLK